MIQYKTKNIETHLKIAEYIYSATCMNCMYEKTDETNSTSVTNSPF